MPISASIESAICWRSTCRRSLKRDEADPKAARELMADSSARRLEDGHRTHHARTIASRGEDARERRFRAPTGAAANRQHASLDPLDQGWGRLYDASLQRLASQRV